MGWDWQHEEYEDEDEEEEDEDEEEEPGTWAPGPWYAVQESTEEEDSISEGSSETSMNDGANTEAGLEDQDSLFVPDGNLSNTNVQASISPPATTPGNTGPHTTSGPLVIPPPFNHIFPVIRPEIARKFYHAMETSGSHNLEVGRFHPETVNSLAHSVQSRSLRDIHHTTWASSAFILASC